MGRPLKQIDVEQLKKLANIHCTMKEIASFFECSVDTLENRFSDVIHQARDHGKMSLRRKQFEVALQTGSVPMLIWLGKQHLDQRDKMELDANQALTVLENSLNSETEGKSSKADPKETSDK